MDPTMYTFVPEVVDASSCKAACTVSPEPPPASAQPTVGVDHL